MIRVKLALIGLVTVLLSSVQAQTVNYTYDDAGRLTGVDYGDGKAIAYTYDLAGNLLRRDVTSGAPFATVSAASFAPNAPLAAEMIVSGFGLGLATGRLEQRSGGNRCRCWVSLQVRSLSDSIR